MQRSMRIWSSGAPATNHRASPRYHARPHHGGEERSDMPNCTINDVVCEFEDGQNLLEVATQPFMKIVSQLVAPQML